jgi:TolB-like protein
MSIGKRRGRLRTKKAPANEENVLAPARPDGNTVRFGEFQANLHTGEVFRSRRKVPLQEKPFQILKALLEHRGEMVTRDELRQKLWSKNVFVDFDRGLKTAISKLRRALGDSAEKPRLVETLPRRGYRLVASLNPQSISEWPLREPHRHRVRLAVLPFRNLSPKPDRKHFTEGITEEIISQLGRLPERRLGVVAQSSIPRHGDGGKSVEEIARELKVEHLLEGSVRFAGKRVRINARLVHAGEQAYLWADSYDRNCRDVLGLQCEVAQTIAREVTMKLADQF